MIDFGKTDGKFEAEKENFEDLFYDDDNHYEKLANDNHFIIYGYKGTGKTMLANYFAKKKEKVASIKKLYAGDFIQEKLLSFSKTAISNEELVVFWKYVYLRELGQLIVSKAKKSRWPFKHYRLKKVDNLDKLLQEVQMIVDRTENFSETVDTTKADLKVTSSPLHSAGMSASTKLSNSIKAESSRATYVNLIKQLEAEVISNMKKKDEYYIIYDDMDQLEEHMNRQDFLSLMKQMLYAADTFNETYRKEGMKARIIHVLRTDIIDLVNHDSHNLIKTVTDFGIEIDWYSKSNKNPETHPLMKMILHKIKNTVPAYKEKSNKEIYDEVFERDSPILQYILEHSFGRPREIVRYLALTQERFPKRTTITIEMLQGCLSDYSKWFYDSMLSEIKINPSVKEIKDTLSFIRSRGGRDSLLLN